MFIAKEENVCLLRQLSKKSDDLQRAFTKINK